MNKDTHPGRSCWIPPRPDGGAFVYCSIPGGRFRSPPAKFTASFPAYVGKIRCRIYEIMYLRVVPFSCGREGSLSALRFWLILFDRGVWISAFRLQCAQAG